MGSSHRRPGTPRSVRAPLHAPLRTPLSCWLGATLIAWACSAHAQGLPRAPLGADGIGFLPGGDAPGFDADAWGPTLAPGERRARPVGPPVEAMPPPEPRRLSAEKLTLGQRAPGAAPAAPPGRDGIGFADDDSDGDDGRPRRDADAEASPAPAPGGAEPVRPPAGASPRFVAGVRYDRMPYELHPIDPDRLPDLPAAQGPSLMEQLEGDDRNMIGVGWHFVATTGRSTPVVTKTGALGLGSFTNPGSQVSLSNTNTLAMTFTHFFTEHWAAELGAGIPPILTLRGHGGIGLPLDKIFPGVSGKLPLIDLGNADSNPLGSTRAWLASTVFKYYLGERDDRFRPFVGLGISYARFTSTNLTAVFDRKLASLGGLLAAGDKIGSLQSLLQDPDAIQKLLEAGANLALPAHTTVSATIKSVWEPVFTVGASYQITRRLWVTGMITYIPLRTTITLNINQPSGVLASNTTDIAANPVLGTVLLNYRF
ncbi:OmpW family outer membrane protein [Burkholderia sp. FERM BP-3421]|uniref:OmpW/AlkL family protein n=1 Tax=Burkholderia sp. FERM BP-3421 TaxID=1494466 RepID=UPI003FCEC1B0